MIRIMNKEIYRSNLTEKHLQVLGCCEQMKGPERVCAQIGVLCSGIGVDRVEHCTTFPSMTFQRLQHNSCEAPVRNSSFNYYFQTVRI